MPPEAEDGTPEEGVPEAADSLPPGSDLPAPVVTDLVGVALAALAGTAARDVPQALRRVLRWEPRKRLRHGAGVVLAELGRNDAFRERVAGWLGEQEPPAYAPGSSQALAREATTAYLVRDEGWQDRLRDVAERIAAATESRAEAELRDRVADLTAALAREREHRARDEASGRAARAELRTERDRARTDAAEARRRAAAAEADAVAAAGAQAGEVERLRGQVAGLEGALEQQRRRAEELERALEGERRTARDGRAAADGRLWLLLETAAAALHGVRRDLALPAPDAMPADTVAARRDGGSDRPRTATAAVDAGRLDALLGLPRAHLVVDGYNVTMTAYGGLPLEDQRTRLLRALAALAARTRAEVTVVFDSQLRHAGPPPAARGVRVAFSDPGSTADDYIAELVAAEPVGRAVVVASSDNEVAAGAVRAGFRAVPSAVLAELLERG